MENQTESLENLRKKIFCTYHLYVNRHGEKSFSFDGFPNNPKSVLVCTAHLNKKDYVFPCPYEFSEIYQEDQTGKLKIAHKDAKGNLVEICENFKTPSYSTADTVGYRDEHGNER